MQILEFADGGTDLLKFSNSSSDVVIKPEVDAKDIIIHQYDGTSLVEFNDGGYSKFTSMAYFPEATLTDASTISWNVLTSPVAKVTLGANRTLGAGTGAQAGQFVSLLVIQDGTGSRTLSFNAAYEFKDDTAPTLTTTAAKGDLFVFRYNGSKFLELSRNQKFNFIIGDIMFAIVESGSITSMPKGNKGVEINGIKHRLLYSHYGVKVRETQ